MHFCKGCMVGLITPATFGVLAFCAPILAYHKISKISPWANIFQRPFLRGFFSERRIFGGAYLRRKICAAKLIGLAL